MRRFLLQPLLLLLLLSVGCRAAVAVPVLTLRQFDHTAWSLREGAPSQIFALAQTEDGFSYRTGAVAIWLHCGYIEM